MNRKNNQERKNFGFRFEISPREKKNVRLEFQFTKKAIKILISEKKEVKLINFTPEIRNEEDG